MIFLAFASGFLFGAYLFCRVGDKKKDKHRTKCSRYRVERDGNIIEQAAE